MSLKLINSVQFGFSYFRESIQTIVNDERMVKIWNPIASACKSVSDWVMVDHPAAWAAVLPELSPSLAPVPEIRLKSPEELVAPKEIREKVAQIFKGQTLQQFYDAFVAYAQSHDDLPFQMKEKRNRGNVIFIHPLLPGKIVKGYSPSPSDKIMSKNVIPFGVPLNPSMTDEEWKASISSEKNIRWESLASSCGRALMADRMRSAIHKKRLDSLYVPLKTLSPISAKPDAEKVVVAEMLDLMSEANMLFIKSGEQKGKLAIFDTEIFGLDEIHRQVDSKEESTVNRNIYLIGGKRNLDLSIGRLISLDLFVGTIQCSPFIYPQFGADYLAAEKKAEVEFHSNILKIKRLRAVLPTTVAVSIAAGILQKMFM